MEPAVELYKTYDALEADRIADLLSDEDIPCAVRDLSISPYPLTIGRFGERRISVPASDVPRARAVIEQAIRDGYLSTEGTWVEAGGGSAAGSPGWPGKGLGLLVGFALMTLVAACEDRPAAAPLLNSDVPELSLREGTRVGFLAPMFTLERLEGGRSSLAEYRGRVVLLNFWATWCGPCRAEMPSLEALSHEFRSDDFLVVGISTDYEGAQIVQPFMESFGLTFPILLDPDMKVNDKFEVRSIPTSIVLDRRGVIRHKFFGAMDWNTPKNRELVRVLIAESVVRRVGEREPGATRDAVASLPSIPAGG